MALFAHAQQLSAHVTVLCVYTVCVYYVYTVTCEIRGGQARAKSELTDKDCKMVTCTVQVTNVSPQASEQQMKELFSYFGSIDEIKVYPEE